MGLTISVDLNYRSKLWQYGKRPEEVMPGLVKYCHVVMGNIWAAEQLLAIPSLIESSAGKDTETLVSAAADSIHKIQYSYPLVHTTAFTFRLEDQYFGVLGKENSVITSRVFRQENIVDRVGSGDCFMAGLIYGLTHGQTPSEIINFSAAAAIGKMKEKGDVTHQSALHINNSIKEYL
jgi:2-dehydro-3-deoxygluconokinase